MKTLIAAFLVASVVAAILTPVVRSVAVRAGAFSVPGGRHHHGRKIPRLGGVAILLAVAAPFVGLFFTESAVARLLRAEWQRASALLVGALVMCTVGFLDDTRRVKALTKLYAQIAVAVLAWVGGYRILAIEIPFVGVLGMGAFALPVTVAWIVGITNAINLIDGLDGLAGGVVFFAALTNLVVAHLSGATFVALVMACTLGGVLGFLIYNFNPARIFMGDSGSYFLGFILATTSLAGAAQKASTAISILVPILALGLPIFDTLFAMVRRYIERRSMFSADRGHIHHRLIDMGLTHRRAVLMLYGVSSIFAVSAIGISLGRNWVVGAALLVMSVAVTGLIRFAASFARSFPMRRQKARLRTRHAELLRWLIPQVPTLFEPCRNEQSVWAVVSEITERAGLVKAELFDAPGAHEGTVVMTLSNDKNGEVGSPDLVRARYPLGIEGRAVAALRFSWHGEYGEVSPQEEVLLQLLVDICVDRLERVGSQWAPRPLAVPEQVARQARASSATAL